MTSESISGWPHNVRDQNSEFSISLSRWERVGVRVYDCIEPD